MVRIDGEPGVHSCVALLAVMVGDSVGVDESVGLAHGDGVDGAPGAAAQVGQGAARDGSAPKDDVTRSASASTSPMM